MGKNSEKKSIMKLKKKRKEIFFVAELIFYRLPLLFEQEEKNTVKIPDHWNIRIVLDKLISFYNLITWLKILPLSHEEILAAK